jgi:uncharacterized repeat protein (TIGR02543 family)
VTLYAVWTANKYSVTLNNDGSTSTLDVTFDTIVPTITNLPTKTGFTFGGYWTQADGKGTQYIDADGVGKKWDIAENTTLYAHWTAGSVNYTVKYYFQTTAGGDNYEHKDGSDDTRVGITGNQTNVTADEVIGFNLQPIVQQRIAGNGLTVVEVKYNRKTITYTFNANGGNWGGSTADATVSDLFGAAVIISDPTKDVGYHCVWNLDVPETFGAENRTFTAQWTANTYKIRFNANDGTGDMADMDMTYDVSMDLSANSFSKEGCFLVGWSKNSTDTTAMYMDKQKISNLSEDNGATVTLYAIWQERSLISVGQIMYSDMTFNNASVEGKIPIGVVFDVGDKVKIVYLDETSDKEWCLKTAGGYNCNPDTSTSDGSGNWQKICEAVSDEDTTGNYPAFEYVNNLGEGWYMPAKDELNAIYTNITVINNSITVLSNTGVSATPLGTDRYWSSSSYNNKSAWIYMFSAGDQSYGNKVGRLSVRAVRAF